MKEPHGEIEALVGEAGHAPGSEGERRVAEWARSELVEFGRTGTTIEEARCWPRWALAYALHGAVAIAGSALSVSAPVPGAVLVALAVALTLLDASGLLIATRRLLGERRTQNVVSRPSGGGHGESNVLLVAHCDGGRGNEGRLVGPLWWTLVAVLACCLLRLAGLEGTGFTVVQFVPTVVLIVVVALLLELALASRPDPGDEGRGVQLALALAARQAHRTQGRANLWIVFTGARHACGQGLRAFLDAHASELPRERTAIVNLDDVREASRVEGFSRREGPLLTLRSHPRLVRFCEEVAEDSGSERPRGVVNRSASDGYAASARGYAAVTVAPGGDPAAFERTASFCDELLRRLEAELSESAPPARAPG